MQREWKALSSAYENQQVSRVCIDRYTDWAEMLDALDTTLTPLGPAWGKKGRPGSIDNPPEMYWDLNLGYEGARRYARDGWPEGTRHFQQLLKSLETRISRTLKTWDYNRGLVGSDIDIGAFVTGHPEFFLNPEEAYIDGGRGAVRTVVLATSVLASVSTDVILRRNVHAIGLCYALEATGIPCRVVSIAYSRDNRYGATHIAHTHVVPIKEPGQDFDMARIAFVGHPAWFRRCGFRLRDLGPDEVVTEMCQQGYGYSLDLSPELSDHMFGAGAIFVSSQPALWNTDAMAWATLKNLMRAQGVHLEEENASQTA